MNKQLLWVIIVILVVAMFTAPVKNFMSKYKKDDNDLNTVNFTQESEETSPSLEASAISDFTETVTNIDNGFWLREYDGEIAVFSGNETSPTLKTGIKVSTLRSNDRAALTQGIYASTSEDVAALIEDLGS
mgnify:CR=1 FL=1